MKLALHFLLPVFCLNVAFTGDDKVLYATKFSTAAGKVPPGWRDLGVGRAGAAWGVDPQGLLRVTWKGDTGLLIYDGALADGESGSKFFDGVVSTEFQKTPDPEVFLGLVGRVQDAKNFYTTRFSGNGRLELIKVTDRAPEVLSSLPTRARYPEAATWKLTMTFAGDRLTGQVFDEKGVEQARVDALEEKSFPAGAVGFQATNFAGAKNFAVDAAQPFTARLTAEEIAKRNDEANPVIVEDIVGAPVPLTEIESLNTPFEKLASRYDVVVAGGGTGGWAAALQASRMGAKVLVVEESDWIGGQMAAAAVTSMDEEGTWNKFPVRERGIYREFHQSMILFYYGLNKDPYRAYYAWPDQLEGGYEPKWTRAVLYAFLKEARKKGTLDLVTGTNLVKVLKDGDTVTGVELEKNGAKRSVNSSVLIEATEYGDVLPLTGARYRAGTVTSDNLVPDSPVQYDTYLGVIREYPEGLPEHLKIKEAPPGYEANRYAKSQLYGKVIWGGEGKGYKGPRSYRVLFAWRGMADADSPATGKLSEGRHTQAGLNGGYQDYPMDVKSLENMETRRAGQRDGIYRTLSVIYYYQQLGLPWGLAEDEGYDTPYNRKVKASLDLRPDLAPMAKYMPQMPYVRESRRGRGIYTLRTGDMGRFENAKLWPTSVALVDYFMDIDHGDTGHSVEHDLDPGKPPRIGGPAQVPFEVFVPEKIDGLVFAEKNISQSRIVNGATRLQPSTMLTGQAAGAIAALAALNKIQPRAVNPVDVQTALLAAGDNLVQRWYIDVPWGSALWQATQLLSLYSVMDVDGPFLKQENTPLGQASWNPEGALDPAVLESALQGLARLANKPAPAVSAVNWSAIGNALATLDPNWQKGLKAETTKDPVTRGAFAVAAAEVVKHTARTKLLTDADVPPPTREEIAAAEKAAEEAARAREALKGKPPKKPKGEKPAEPAKDEADEKENP